MYYALGTTGVVIVNNQGKAFGGKLLNNNNLFNNGGNSIIEYHPFNTQNKDLLVNLFNDGFNVYGLPIATLNLNGQIIQINNINDIDVLRDNLSSGFLECRVVNTNYKTLQNIIHQRKNHKSKKWNTFIEMLLKQVQHPEFLVNNQGE